MTIPFTLADMEPPDRPHWEALRDRRLLIQRCQACGMRYFPATRCACSGGAQMEWVESAGSGRIHAFAVFHQAYAPHLASELPYTVVVVELDEGPLMVSLLTAEAGYAPAIDGRVHVDFVVPSDGLATHRFAPREARAGRAP